MSLFDRIVVASIPMIPKFVVGKVAAPYVAGESLEDGLRTARALNSKGIMATMDVLGEFVHEKDKAEASVKQYLDLIAGIARDKLDANISVKLTAMGLDIDPQYVRQNVRKIMSAASGHGMFVRIDMEDSPRTDETIRIYREMRQESRCGLVVQAYLKRTSDDVRKLCEEGPSNFRLCKGIYVEPEAIAYKGKQEIRDNFMLLLDQMFTAGAYVGIATHDEYLTKAAEELIKKHKLTRDKYEFQMLLGVKPDLRDALVSRGHRLRVYVPFGESWYGYCTRRLKENPAIAGYVAKAMIGLN
ncbi:MAG TPA: proline dehydrogenase family protein [bacterium]|jgi:proline dehydrogenase